METKTESKHTILIKRIVRMAAFGTILAAVIVSVAGTTAPSKSHAIDWGCTGCKGIPVPTPTPKVK